MMTRAGLKCSLVLLSAALLGLSGCGRNKSNATSGADARTLEAAQKLPEGTNVLLSLQQNDYPAAVSALAKLHQDAGTEEQRRNLQILDRYVDEQLVQASTTNDAATEAYKALRLMTMGR